MAQSSPYVPAHSYPPPGARKPAQYERSARDAYPTFLSLPETLSLQLSYLSKGLLDAFRWDLVVSTVASDAEIRVNIVKSLLLNGLSLASIYVFDLLLQPLVHNQQKWLHRNVGWFYRVLWLFPVVGASLYLNSSWCALIAGRAYALRHGGRRAPPPSTYSGILTALATSAYRAVMICTSVIMSVMLAYVPVVGPAAGFALFCWVDAYYCFEPIWIARGLSLAQRVRHLEERWAYYFAFGFPSSLLCMYGSTLANAALFALLLPSYIIMAMHARPVPSNPYNPKSSTSLSGNTSAPAAAAGDPIRYPSPFVPIRLPVFAPVLWINDRIVSLLSVGGGRRPSASGPGARTGLGVEVGAARPGQGLERRRGLSDATVESVEEGEGDAVGEAAAAYASASAARRGALGEFGAGVGRRRKAE